MSVAPHVSDHVLAFLVELGGTGDDVAEVLRIMDVRGTRGARTCPLARATRAAFPDLWWLSIGTETFSAGPVGSVVQRVMPPGARGFLEGFQAKPCRYPELLKKNKSD